MASLGGNCLDLSEQRKVSIVSRVRSQAMWRRGKLILRGKGQAKGGGNTSRLQLQREVFTQDGQGSLLPQDESHWNRIEAGNT